MWNITRAHLINIVSESSADYLNMRLTSNDWPVYGTVGSAMVVLVGDGVDVRVEEV